MIDLAERQHASRAKLTTLEAELLESKKLAAGRACVYVTGSFARGEANDFSDLDLFIVGKCESQDSTETTRAPKRLLKRLDEICIKAELISATRAAQIPDFSGDGQYLAFHTVRDLVSSLGSPEDDATNTFTARLLLLLESTPLIEHEVYGEVISDVIVPYWRDFKDHESDFMPAFLANDILRLWRTFCVNYEARTETDPIEKKAKRKLKNYKLKHSRMLTCYSALLFLLATYERARTVSPADVLTMTGLTPIERLRWLKAEFPKHSVQVDRILEKYTGFLEETNAAENALIERFLDPNQSRTLIQESYAFGDLICQLLEDVGVREDGTKAPLYRLIVV